MLSAIHKKGTGTLRAFTTDPSSPGGIAPTDREPAPADSTQALVRVTHFSLNRGELNSAKSGAGGRAIGWDVAGVVEKAAANGTGPGAGTPVVGFSRASQGWAELVPIDVRDLAAVPEGISAVQAASLPVAGLTALYSLERGERILGSRVLVTGATGGVGNFAVALGALMGAEVVAQVRRADQAEAVRKLGASEVVVDESGEKIAQAGPYRLIVDGLGNELTARAIHSLTADGRAILYGVSAGGVLGLNAGFMLGTGGGRVEGFNLYRESERESISLGLSRLLKLIAKGRLAVSVDQVAAWAEAPHWAEALLQRKFAGKAVISV